MLRGGIQCFLPHPLYELQSWLSRNQSNIALQSFKCVLMLMSIIFPDLKDKKAIIYPYRLSVIRSAGYPSDMPVTQILQKYWGMIQTSQMNLNHKKISTSNLRLTRSTFSLQKVNWLFVIVLSPNTRVNYYNLSFATMEFVRWRWACYSIKKALIAFATVRLKRKQFCFYSNIRGLFDVLGTDFEPTHWRLFIDKSLYSL